MRHYITRLWLGFLSLCSGLRITFGHMLRKPVTLEYPHVEPELSAAYRGAIKLIRFDETNSHDCVACMQCVNICPSFCIDIEGGRVDGIKKKRAEKFTMDFNLCSLCGLCLDVCPTTTLEYSRLYDAAGYDPEAFRMDLLDDYRGFEDQFRSEQAEREQAEKEKKDAEKKARAAEKAAAAAAASESSQDSTT